MNSNQMNWAPIVGQMELRNGDVVFKGELRKDVEAPTPSFGLFVCDRAFIGGTVSTDVRFSNVDKFGLAEILIYYNPSNQTMVSAGLGRSGMFAIAGTLDSQKWTTYAQTGERTNLQRDRSYRLSASFIGSSVTLTVDGVDVLSANLPRAISPSQVGLLFMGENDITASNYTVQTTQPKAFVVMEFGSPYDEVYGEVIERVCSSFNIDVNRADEIYSPGLIIADITREITESKVIIAEITPRNPNVYFEVGYAHACNKPTILIAEKGTDIPFDVSPFRVLLYENSIGGRTRLEEGLSRHLEAIMGMTPKVDQ